MSNDISKLKHTGKALWDEIFDELPYKVKTTTSRKVKYIKVEDMMTIIEERDAEIERLNDLIEESDESYTCKHHRTTGGYESCCDCSEDGPCSEAIAL